MQNTINDYNSKNDGWNDKAVKAVKEKNNNQKEIEDLQNYYTKTKSDKWSKDRYDNPKEYEGDISDLKGKHIDKERLDTEKNKNDLDNLKSAYKYNEAKDYYSKMSQYQTREDLNMRKQWLDDNVYDPKYRKEYEDFYKQGEKYYQERYQKAGFTEKERKQIELDNDFRKGKINNKEYELYKKAIENPDSIDPMTENSTDWEALDRKYGSRYKNERKSAKPDYDHFAGWELYSDDPNRYGDIVRNHNERNALKDRYQGTYNYLQSTTNMSGAEILELLKKIDEDKK